MNLSEHMKETIDMLDGYKTGTLIVESDNVYLEKNDGSLLELDNSYLIEVRKGNQYEAFSYHDVIKKKTPEGWPLLAGFYARVKEAI